MKKEKKVKKEKKDKKKKLLSLRELVIDRNSKYHNATIEIMDRLREVVFPAMAEVVGLKGKETEFIIWEDIDLFGDILVVVAQIAFPIGYKVQHEDEIIEINAENEMFFRRYVRIGIPIEKLEKLSKEQVVELLMSFQQQNHPDPTKDFEVEELTKEQKQTLINLGHTIEKVDKAH